MTRSLALLPIPLALVLAACGIENRFGEGLPQWPQSFPPPVEEITFTDAIMQVQTPKVDILWTIDNSCSMGPEQSDLTANFPSFMDYFLGSGLDYHVGVTSTDLDRNYNGSQGKLRVVNGLKYIDADTPEPVAIYTSMATMGTTGSGTEKGLGATFLALEENRDTSNAGFYRDEAALHTIIISDEPDLTTDATISDNEFKDWYDGLKPDYDMRTFSSIIDYNTGGAYQSVTQEIGGIVWDILSDDWPQLLERLGVQAAGLKREYFLSHLPVPGSIVVSVEDVSGASLDFEEAEIDPVTGLVIDQNGDGTPDGDWTYDGIRNSITFVEYIPNSLSTIMIDYTVLASQAGQTDVIE
jgi:hypothetical protein